MKNVLKFLSGIVIIAAASCSGSGSKGTTDTDSTANYSSNSTDAAIDSNEKELKTKGSTELKADYEYAVKAANGGLMEVELGKLAQSKKPLSPQVLEFGKMMVTDHSKANTELNGYCCSQVYYFTCNFI
jgi:putative membrane protein